MCFFVQADSPYSLQSWTSFPGNSCGSFPSACRVLNLEVNKRICNDHWHAAFLDDCRHGRLNDGKHDTFNQYCFIHGFPTAACGSLLPPRACLRQSCNNTACNSLEAFVTKWLEAKDDKERRQTSSIMTNLNFH